MSVQHCRYIPPDQRGLPQVDSPDSREGREVATHQICDSGHPTLVCCGRHARAYMHKWRNLGVMTARLLRAKAGR